MQAGRWDTLASVWLRSIRWPYAGFGFSHFTLADVFGQGDLNLDFDDISKSSSKLGQTFELHTEKQSSADKSHLYKLTGSKQAEFGDEILELEIYTLKELRQSESILEEGSDEGDANTKLLTYGQSGSHGDQKYSISSELRSAL